MAQASYITMTLQEMEEQSNLPSVLMCAKCWRPLGDTEDWAGCNFEDNIILLKAVTNHVVISQKKLASTIPKDCGSTLQHLYCKGCRLPIGKLYTSAPYHLNYKRNLYSLKVNAIKCYSFGREEKQATNTEVVETLMTFNVLEKELKKCKQILGFLQRDVAKLEENCEPDSSEQ
ncbi:protein Mis18-alpha-like isoform X1 [Mixophyes fleayi]|uniref:protein Mis18-alpha-like isoform X1 n=1 Tax=Mixophyes fleayi TaxID=3061075 RepID=UPI003F4D8A35